MSPQKLLNGYLPDHQEELMEKVLNNVNAYICILDIQNLRILWSNKYSTENIGYPSSVILNMTSEEIFSLIHPDHRKFLSKEIADINSKNKNSQCSVLKIKNKDNGWIWVLTNYSIYERNSYGKVTKILLIAKEIDIAQIQNKIEVLHREDKEIEHPMLVSRLSAREKEVVEQITDGKSDREISESLYISIHTAKTHRKRIIRKLGLKNSRTLIKYACENGLVKTNPSFI